MPLLMINIALNLETGEITLIPQLEIYLDSQQ